jgi:GTPase Era involved in 16S rRNA processing
VSYYRFGDHFFATRERLTDVMRGASDLAHEIQGSLPDSSSQLGLETERFTSFLFMVCGEVNSGKSTLLNGLFGHDLCRVSSLPETDRVLRYQYAATSSDSVITPSLQECRRPIEFLKDFHLIDTPGTNSPSFDQQELTTHFLPTADLIFFVFSVTNPWESSTWNLISELPHEVLQRAVLIIQKSDQRLAVDLEVIKNHMLDLCHKRVGQALPIFSVSGKNAYEAKIAAPCAENHLRQSGFTALEAFISQKIFESTRHRKVLESWRGQVADVLHGVEDQIDQQNRQFSSQGSFLDTIEREIDDIREGFVLRLNHHFTDVVEVFESEAIWCTRLLRRRLWLIPTLYRLVKGDRTSAKLEAIFIERLQATVEKVAEQDGLEVVAACRQHWGKLGLRVKNSMGVDLGSVTRLDDTLHLAKKHFVYSLGKAARQGIGNLRVRNLIDKDLRRRNRALKAFNIVILLLLTIGSTCGALGIPWLPTIFCGLAVPFICGGYLVAVISRRRMTEDFQSRMLSTCGNFATDLRKNYEDALRLVFQDYASSLTAVRHHLAQEKFAIEPRVRRWNELFLTLKAIEQEL